MTTYRALARVYRHLSNRRKRQLALVLMLMLLAAAAEMLTLGAIIPFLTFLLGGADSAQFGVLVPVLEMLTWESSQSLMIPVTLIFAGAALFAGLVRIALTWASNYFVYGLGNDLATQIYENILYQPYSYHVQHSSSDVLGSIAKIQLVINNVIFHAMRGFISLVIAACILTVLLIIDPVVAFSALIGIGSVFIIARLISSSCLKKNSKTIAEMQSQRVQVVQEGIGGIREVLIDRVESVFIDKFQALDQRLQTAHLINFSIARSPRYAVEAIGMIIIAFIALYLATGSDQAAANPTSALPVLGVLALGAQRLLPLMQDLYQAWASMVGNRQSVDDVVRLLALSIPANRKRPDAGIDLPFSQALRLENVSYCYPSVAEPVIRDLSLEINKGSTIGLIGKTGSGKSTLVDLIMGLLDPTQGTISVDGLTLGPDTLRTWQRTIAHVPQAIFLQDASIAENIAFGIEKDLIDMDAVQRAAALAQIAPFIDTQPHRYDTRVGEHGVRLSGGQRQRIGIARALYKNADLLILDEATSALDQETERAVMESIKALSGEVTIVIIAHRFSTLASCDKIIELQDGRIIAEGSYAQVVRSNDNAPSELVENRLAPLDTRLYVQSSGDAHPHQPEHQPVRQGG